MEISESRPNILYKYRDFNNENNKNTLFNFELYLPSPAQFNDPIEGKIPFIYDPRELTPVNIFSKIKSMVEYQFPLKGESEINEITEERYKTHKLFNKEHLEIESKKNQKEIDTLFGIYSLTTTPLNYLMWSHYSNSHQGFTLGFDVQILSDVIGGSMGPVTYSEDIPKFKLFENILSFLIKLLATKSDVWEYENEYRIIKHNGAKTTIKYPKEMIKEIYFGCKMDIKNKQEILDFINTKEIKCDVFDLSLDQNKFALNPSKININN